MNSHKDSLLPSPAFLCLGLVLSFGLVMVFLWVFASPVNADAPDSKGTDFWLAFPPNVDETATQTLFITGEIATTGTVITESAPIPFSVTPGSVTTVTLSNVELALSDTIEDKGIHVTANDEIIVYGLNRMTASADAYLGLPTDVLGTEYVILTYETALAGMGTQLVVVGTESSTTVTITLSATTNGHTVGVPYTITLNQGQTYLLQNDTVGADLSGSTVIADKPIAVFGSNKCAQIPAGTAGCDHIIEHLPPVSTWGQSFATLPLATRLNGDRFRILASEDNTSVIVNNSVFVTLDRGEFYEQIISGMATIAATAPILVAQYSHSTEYDGVTSDPFMMFIPPYEQFMGEYTLSTPALGFSGNYINIVVSDAAVGSITVDGTAIPAGNYTAIGNGFSGVAHSVSLGSHHMTGTLPFGVFSYGFGSDYNSYGYPGGASYVPLSSINSVTLTLDSPVPPVGQQFCMTALVEEQFGTPMEGVRVDFAVSGVNTASGFDLTDVNGEAIFCYTGSSLGDDTIIASAGAKSDTKYVSWTTDFVLTVSRAGTGSGTVTSIPAGINCGATCQASFTDGTVVTLTAMANTGSTFTGWAGGGCSGMSTCQVTMTETKQVIATFAQVVGYPGYGSTPAPGSNINVGTASIGRTISTTLTISETGEATLMVTLTLSGADAGDFGIAPSTLTIVDGGAAQNLTIECTPLVTRTLASTLTVMHNAPDSPALYPLSCTGSTLHYIYLPLVLRNQ